MKQKINKDTVLYGSFSTNPGNNGCEFFNNEFKKHSINAIYKSFYVKDISLGLQAAKTLNFGGFAVSMPHKIEIIKHLDAICPISKLIGAVNTVVNRNGRWVGYNTDFSGINHFLGYAALKSVNELYIIGNGGFSKAIQFTCSENGIKYHIIDRNGVLEIDNYKDRFYLNATPADIISVNNKVYDLRPDKPDGKLVARFQAYTQLEIYTGIRYDDSEIFSLSDVQKYC